MFFTNIKRNIITIALPLFLLVAGLYFVPIQIFETDFSKMPGDLGDTRLNNYFLEHGFNFFSGKTANYWDAPFLYPFENALAFSDNLLGTLPVYILYRIAGFDRETSFQLWLLSLFILNYICCYWVLKKMSGNTALSATGAYIYSFSIILVANIYNVQTYPRFIVPLVFYWAWNYLSKKELKYFLFLSLGIVYQFYCGLYLGFLLLYALLFLLLSYIIIYKEKDLFKQFINKKIRNSHLAIIVMAIIFLIPLFWPYIKISSEVASLKFSDIETTIPTLRSYFFTSNAPVLWNFLYDHGVNALENWWCHFLFLGALPWLGVLAVPVTLILQKDQPEQRKFTILLITWLFFTFIFALNIGGFTLYKLFFIIPGFSSIRGVHRLINIEIFCFIIVFVFAFRELYQQNKIWKTIIWLFPVLVIADNLINPLEVKRFEKSHTQYLVNNLKNKISSIYEPQYSAIAFIPYSPNNFYENTNLETHLSVMLASQDLNIPCVNGYSGYLPEAYPDFFNNADTSSLYKWTNYNNINNNEIQKIFEFESEPIKIETINLKSFNNKFVCIENNIAIANRDNAHGWETFQLIIFNENICAIRAYNNRYLGVVPENDDQVKFLNTEFGAREKFQLVNLENNFVALRSTTGKYLRVEDNNLIYATGTIIGEREKFLMHKL
jgi:hypothetical protein